MKLPTHKSILDKLSTPYVALTLEADLRRLIFEAGISVKHGRIQESEQLDKILVPLHIRWNAVLGDEPLVNENYVCQTQLTLALMLHKKGFSDTDITQQAHAAIDRLNELVALSDAFERASPSIKALLESPVKRPTKLPGHQRSISFFRQADIVAIRYKGKYLAAYVHGDTGVHEAPIIEFYESIFDSKPTAEQLIGAKAKGRIFPKHHQGITDPFIQKFGVFGMTYTNDPAQQFSLIDSASENSPDQSHLLEDISHWTGSNQMDIQSTIADLFSL